MSPHVSTLTLNQFRYGELESAVADTVRQHLDDCDRCARRLHVQEQAREAFVVQPVPEAIRQADDLKPANNRRWYRLLLPVLAAAALLIALPLVFQPDTTHTRPKGALPELEVWVGTPSGPRPLHGDEVLHAGDRVQLLYDPHGAALVTLAGRDGSGALEVYQTFQPEKEGLQPAPFALTLDDAAGPQEFWVITSDEPLTEAQIQSAVKGTMKNVTLDHVSVPKE